METTTDSRSAVAAAPRAESTPSPGDVTAPASIIGAVWLVAFATAATTLGAVLSAFDRVEHVDQVTVWADLVLIIGYVAWLPFFAAMMRRGREWGRMTLAVLVAIGVPALVASLLQTGTMPLSGALQVGLGGAALAGFAVALVLMFAGRSGAYIGKLRDRRRLIALRPRKILLVAHVAISVSWLGVVCCQLTLAAAIAVSRDPDMHYAAFTAMSLLDNVFLGGKTCLH